jgi:23S rRNA (guanosine2251-2'-O)-methyltransferase
MPQRVAGRIPVLEALRAGKRKPRKLYVLRDAKGLEALRDAARSVPTEAVTRDRLDDLSGGVLHQGVVLEAESLPVFRAEAWVKREFSPDSLVVVLDGVEDPHNFGAIVRTAAACDALAVMFARDRAAPVSPASVKAAAGGMEHVDLVEAANVARLLELLKEAGFWIAGFEVDAEQTLWETDLTGRTALVIGSEGKGMRRLVSEGCDFHLRIPLPGKITALNASVSAAVALVECLRQRKAKNK